MLATPLPAPAERSDANSRGAAPDSAARRHEDGRFADLLRQRRAAAAQTTERNNASREDDAQAGRTATATTSASNAATAPHLEPGTSREAGEDEATRADPARSDATDGSQAAAPAPVGAEKPAANDLSAPAATGDAGVPIAVPSQVDAPARGSEAPQTASTHVAGGRPSRVAAKAEADAADPAQGSPTAGGTAQDPAPTAAPAALPAAAEPSRAAPVSRGADASLPSGAAPARISEIAPPAVTSVALPAPVASPEFGELLGAQVSLFARDGLQQAELRLNPAEMGPIGVQIEIAGNEARINFNADLATTREAIGRALPELAAALRGEGLTLAGGGVFDRPPSARDGTSARATAGARRTGGERVAALPAGAPRGFAPQGAVDLYA